MHETPDIERKQPMKMSINTFVIGVYTITTLCKSCVPLACTGGRLPRGVSAQGRGLLKGGVSAQGRVTALRGGLPRGVSA